LSRALSTLLFAEKTTRNFASSAVSLLTVSSKKIRAALVRKGSPELLKSLEVVVDNLLEPGKRKRRR
jgi:hypothetical protein